VLPNRQTKTIQLPPDEIKVGDNDNLSALVANLVNADWLVLLTDQRGLFTADRAQTRMLS